MARRISRRGIDLMIQNAGGPNGEDVEVPPVRIIDAWDPFRINELNEVEINEIEILENLQNPIPWPSDIVNIRTYEKLPEPEDMIHLDPEQFLDKVLVEEYTCQICFLVCNYNYMHAYRDCKAFMCLSCFNMLRQNRQNNDCIRKCHRGNFISEVKPLDNHRSSRSLSMLKSLKIVCPQKCDQSLNFPNYRKHLKKYCPKDENFCKFCKRIHVSSYECKEKIVFERDQLKEEIAKLKESLQNATNANSTTEQITYSNPVKGKRSWDGNRVRIAAHYKGKEYRFTDLDIDDNTGRDLRTKIESLVGEPVGPIVKIDHTIIQDERRIRQNMISHKPAHILVYPTDQVVEEGQTLKINVLQPGGVV